MPDKIERLITQENMPIHLGYLIEKVDKIDAAMQADYVTKSEFEPIKRIVYGVVMVIIAGVIAAGLRGMYGG